MDFKWLNESFADAHQKDLAQQEPINDIDLLRQTIEFDVKQLPEDATPMTRATVIENSIEKVFPDSNWFDIVNTNIEDAAYTFSDVSELIDYIMNNLSPEFIDSVKSLNEQVITEIYDEPELIGMGYAAPVSKDFLKEVSSLDIRFPQDIEALKEEINEKVFEIDEFNDYWNKHKEAMMKNINAAIVAIQDLNK